MLCLIHIVLHNSLSLRANVVGYLHVREKEEIGLEGLDKLDA
jgi:hypothetical protein